MHQNTFKPVKESKNQKFIVRSLYFLKFFLTKYIKYKYSEHINTKKNYTFQGIIHKLRPIKKCKFLHATTLR